MDQEHVDLAVLDLMMPKMDGYAFTPRPARGEHALPIMLVSATGAGQPQGGLRRGFDD
jgi:CheY-like chemotaxis protein